MENSPAVFIKLVSSKKLLKGPMLKMSAQMGYVGVASFLSWLEVYRVLWGYFSYCIHVYSFLC
ncbi:hypothetical protein BDZ94DRAFT_1269928 [Collybia nuda]|uniref:Uncharacterized protein n=1 Tax=Collybia nuda TaxID=64659 RepID=A0A9P6CAU6_9AGAR|nr:hypothetical protein BDZ94DRAFT_1269928 [Collybia nuda]